MHTRIAALLLAALAASLAACSSPPSQDQIAANCTKALDARAIGDKVKPKACDGLTADNYDAVYGDYVLRHIDQLAPTP